MRRSLRANTVPWAMTNRVLSLASRVITSCASASADPPRWSGAAPLRGRPVVEGRAAVELQAVEKNADEARAQAACLARRERLDSLLDGPADLDRVDRAVG